MGFGRFINNQLLNGHPSTLASPLAPANGAKDVPDGADAEQAALKAIHALMEDNYAILNAFKANMQKCKVR